MRLIICVSAGMLLLGACQKATEPAPSATANTETPAATPAAATSINETSWEYTDPKTKEEVTESIDANGNYITNSKAGKHMDHGTVVMKDGKACFTSAMTKEGETCWTDPKIEVGQSGTTTSDKGETLSLKRIAYTPLTM